MSEEGINVDDATKVTKLDKATKVTDTLRDKIKSKMDVAKFFTGFITLLIGLLLKDEKLPSTFNFRIGVVFLIASLGLCVAAMFTYDHLLWPKERLRSSNDIKKEHFHSGNDIKIEQELAFQTNLKTEMVKLWKWLFVPAVVCFGLGFLFLLLPKLSLTDRLDCKNGVCQFDYKNGLWILVLLIAFIIPTVLCVYKWPRLEKNKEGAAPITSK